ncbi:MAG: hypothetical protein UU77_C0007G0033 [candidate division WWE3 bacterium GW2011_GWC1_41_7]|uniref:Uncharacterized protein n=2 Tax=Katanobacteria TaxID=422282 RepID=A0A0G0XBR8_UNCKA|nr:MAG: hypothetical protein UU77_C0007G0033 [candidate division WWE3 bacterium GW2011_GWC1_41_7]KKS21832.1 MAG: hypothetical protein UU80_C0019G0012 [candidate division WWE3 bacterium GW2011_GWA1_41_8]
MVGDIHEFSEDFTKNLKFFTQKQVPKAITIYMPTSKVWHETSKDRILLKNSLEQAEKELIIYGVRSTDAKELTKNAKKLLRREEFWKEMRDGLALFISENFFKFYKLDKSFKPMSVVQDYFFLTPLASLIERYPDYYVLTISQNDVDIFKGSYGSLSRISTKKVPENIAEALWMDEPEKSIQMKTPKKGGRNAPKGAPIYHGHGAVKESYKNRLTRYARTVNRDLNEEVTDRNLPLVVVTTSFFYYIYREVNTYPNLLDDFIEGSPENMTILELEDESWEIVRSIFTREIQEDIRKYRDMLHTRKALKNIKEIVTSSYQARLEALFVEPDEKVWGNFFEDDNRVTVSSEREPDDEELLNLSLINTLRNGGKVYSLNQLEESINGEQSYTGILRY